MIIIFVFITILILFSIFIYKTEIKFIKIDSNQENKTLNKKTCNCGRKSKRTT